MTTKWKEQGVEIDIDSTGRFTAAIGDIEISDPTLEGAREKIGKAVKARATARKLSLPVVGVFSKNIDRSAGEKKAPLSVMKTTLIGVNRTSRDLMFSDVFDGDLDRVLPATPENEALLKQWLAIKAQYDRLYEQTVGIGKLGYGRIDAEEYNKILTQVEDQYNHLVLSNRLPKTDS